MKRISLMALVHSAVFASTVLPPPDYLGSGVTGGMFNLDSPPFYSRSGYGRGNNTNEIVFNLRDSLQAPNNIRFDAVPFQEVNWGQPFLLGYLTYTNGLWLTGRQTFLLELQTVDSRNHSPAAGPPATLSYTQSGQYLLSLIVTPNIAGAPPEQNADILYFQPVSGGSCAGPR